MSSRKMLVIAGPTYFQRLWCCWELFIRSIATKDMRHTIVWPLGETDLSACIKNFDVESVQCFRQEDKAKILEIIGGFNDGDGKAFFNKRIKAMASTLSINSWIQQPRRDSLLTVGSLIKNLRGAQPVANENSAAGAGAAAEAARAPAVQTQTQTNPLYVLAAGRSNRDVGGVHDTTRQTSGAAGQQQQAGAVEVEF